MERRLLAISVLVAAVLAVEIFPKYQDVTIQENVDSATLPCVYRSEENHLTGVNSIQWTLNDRNGPSVLAVDNLGKQVAGRLFAGRVSLGDSASLILMSPSIGDSAIYTCTVNLLTDEFPAATAFVELVVKECEEPEPIAAGICLTVDVILILLAAACIWFLQNRKGHFVFLVLCLLRVLTMVSLVSGALSVILLAVHVSRECVHSFFGLYPAGIVFCVVGLVTGIVSWYATWRLYGGNKPCCPSLSRPRPVHYAAKEEDAENPMLPNRNGERTATVSTEDRNGLRAVHTEETSHDRVRVISLTVEPSRQRSSRFDELLKRATPSADSRRNLSTSESIPESCGSFAPSSMKNASVDHLADIDVELTHTPLPIRAAEPQQTIPRVKRTNLHKAKSEEILRSKAPATPVFRRSLPLSLSEKMDQDQFMADCKTTGDYYVETIASRLLKNQLLIEDVRGITLLGSRGDGKSATARYLAWILHRDYGYLPLKVTTVSEIERLCIEGQRIVFVVDDPLGKICTSSELHEHWASGVGRLQACLATSHVKIIATVRTDIWTECKYSVMRFPPFTSTLNVSELQTQGERYSMLCKHLSLSGISPEDSAWLDTIHQIVHRGKKSGFPQCCQLVRTSKFFNEKAAKLFMNPLDIIRKDLRRLRKDDPWSFCVLALVIIHGGKLCTTIMERPVDKLPSSEQDKVIDVWQICYRGEKSVFPTPEQFQESADSLCSSYLVKTQTCYEFSLPSLAEAVFIELGMLSPDIIFKWCHGDWITRLVRAEGCEVTHSDTNYLVLNVPLYTKFASALTDELLKGNVTVVLDNPSWDSVDFLTVWKSLLQSKTVDKLLAVGDMHSQVGMLSRLAAKGPLSVLKIISDPSVWDGDIQSVRNQYGQTLLHSAAAGGQLTTVLFLLEKGLDPNVIDDGDDGPLHVAALNGHTDVVQTLLKHGANPDLSSNLHRTPLQAAALCGNVKTLSMLSPRVSGQILQEHSTNVDETSSVKKILKHLGGDELHEAARECELVKIHHLLDNGFNKNGQNNLGWTPLYISTMLGHTEAVSLMLTRGANPNITAKSGLSALDEAVMAVKDSIISLLLSYGSKRSSFV